MSGSVDSIKQENPENGCKGREGVSGVRKKGNPGRVDSEGNGLSEARATEDIGWGGELGGKQALITHWVITGGWVQKGGKGSGDAERRQAAGD